MGYVRRRGTKAARKLPDNFEEVKSNFLSRVSSVVCQYKIPSALIINFDQIGVPIVPVSNWTMELQGSKQVEITGLDDKRQLTVALAETLAGTLLPPQVIYQGKTDQCHPTYKFPSSWHITHSESHWSTAETMQQYIDSVIVPYVEDQHDTLDLPLRQKALLIMDVFRAHRVGDLLSHIKSKDIEIVFVPGGCTSELQPLDISGNGHFKDSLTDSFTNWYSDQVASSLASGHSVTDTKVDLRLSTLKPLHAKWLLSAVDSLSNMTDVLLRGWEKAGITDAVTSARSTFSDLCDSQYERQ